MMRFISAGLILLLLNSMVHADLTGHWTFEEGSGDTTADLSPSGTTGLITNAATGGLGTDGSVWVNDPDRGSVISFNGAADGAFVSAGFIPTMSLDNDFTWAFWANHDPSNTQTNNIIFGNRRDADGVDFTPRQFIKFTPTKFEWHMNGNGNDNMEYDDLIGSAGIWNHHAVVKTGADLTYYRNGLEVNASTVTQPLDAPQPLFFGGDNTMSGGEQWMGMLDDVRIYDNALTAAEVLALAPDAPPPPPPPIPVGEGNWSVRLIGIDQRPPAFDGDGDVNDTQEAIAILNYVGPHNGDYTSNGTSVAGQPGAGGPTTDENLNLNGWGIWEDHQVSRNVVDLYGSGGTGSFNSDHPYPGPELPNLDGTDFVVSAKTDDPLNFAPGQYAITFASDDGGFLTVNPTDGSTFAFSAEVNTDGDDVLDDTILFNGTRGIAVTCGEFTVGAAGLSAHIESAMFERAGGDGFEIAISDGLCEAPFGNGFFELISDNNIANDAGTGFLVTTGTPVPNSSNGLACDLDADSDCDQDDIDLLYAAGTDAAGIEAWLTQASAEGNPYKADTADTYILGDANLDGDVDSSDLGLLLNNFNKSGGTAAIWNGGDLNADGGVDSADLGLLLNNFGTVSAGATVPEPTAISLLFVAALGMLGLRRRS